MATRLEPRKHKRGGRSLHSAHPAQDGRATRGRRGTKLGDTAASEVGKAYGKTCYLSTTLKRVPPGTEGAVSLEGTLAGFAGSVLAASYAVAVGLTPRAALLPVVVAAFVATTCESWLGAGAQGKVKWLTNEVINFLNTLIGAGVGAALSFRLFNLY